MTTATQLIRRTAKMVRGEIETTPAAPPIEVPVTTVVHQVPPQSEIDAWLHAIATDSGCQADAGRWPDHRACEAIERLEELRELPTLAVGLLERAVTETGRAHCVRLRAVRTLANAEHPLAHRALARMNAVTQRRIAFGADRHDRQLGAVLLEALRRTSPRQLSV